MSKPPRGISQDKHGLRESIPFLEGISKGSLHYGEVSGYGVSMLIESGERNRCNGSEISTMICWFVSATATCQDS